MRRLELKERRDLLIPRLEAMGFKIAAEPDGAFMFSLTLQILQKTARNSALN